LLPFADFISTTTSPHHPQQNRLPPKPLPYGQILEVAAQTPHAVNNMDAKIQKCPALNVLGTV